jgi:hypothetical protein
VILPVYIVDIIGDIVNQVKGDVLTKIIANETAVLEDGPSLIQTINYQYGHKRELIETLFQMDKGDELAFQKYPLIYLVQDFRESRGQQPGIYADVSLNIVIAHHTTRSFKITERYAQVFKPVLYPIYLSLIEKIAASKAVNMESEDLIRHDKTDRSYWGTQALGGNEANKLNDAVDAIEIENLALKIIFKNC